MSWKRVFSKSEKRKSTNGVHREDSTRSDGSAEISYSNDVMTMMESVPTDELDLVHFIVGHGILRRDMRCVGDVTS